MRGHFGSVWESIADAVPDQAAVVQGDRRVTWREYEQRRPAGAGVPRRRAEPRIEGRDVPLQLTRVLRDQLCRAQDPRRPDQRQLPVPRQRAPLPARERRRRSPGVPHARSPIASPGSPTDSRRCVCSSRSTTAPHPTAPTHVDGAVAYEDLQPRSRRRRASSPTATRCTSSTPAGRPGCPRASCTRCASSPSSS